MELFYLASIHLIRFIRYVIGSATASAAAFNSRAGIPSRPVALFGEIFLSSDNTKLEFTLCKEKLSITLGVITVGNIERLLNLSHNFVAIEIKN